MTDLAQDVQERAAASAKEAADRKTTNGSKKKKAVAVTPAAATEQPTTTQAVLDPVAVKAPAEPKTKAKPVRQKPEPKTEPKPKPVVDSAAKCEPKPVVEANLNMPKPMSGSSPIYLLFCAPRKATSPENRRMENMNTVQARMLLGVSFDRQILDQSKVQYAKDHPDFYFWVSTQKALGEAPKNMRLALQFENVLIANGIM